MKRLKTLKDLNVKGKNVLLRSDLNSDIVEGRVLKGERIVESLKTIKFLKKKGGRVIILAHQGNPGKKDFLDLSQHAKLLGRNVKFVDDVVGESALEAIRGMRNGDVILLDNVRNVEDEFLPDKKNNIFLKRLVPLVDVYVNDAFSVAHRNHFSIVGFAKHCESGIGLLFEKEIRALEKINIKGCLYILGGAKPESNIKLLEKGNKVLACGLFGQVCLAAKGMKFGYQDDFLRETVLVKSRGGGKREAVSGWKKFLKELKGKLDNVETPVDFAVNFEGKRWEFLLSEFPKRLRIEDIGAVTIEGYCDQIRKAHSVYMKGPAGWAEDKRFAKGTVEILKAVADCPGFSLVGGGQLSEVIEKSGINKKKFGHISLSGGACLAVVSGERLVGLEALGYY
jgi:phosphoglycerate kinase